MGTKGKVGRKRDHDSPIALWRKDNVQWGNKLVFYDENIITWINFPRISWDWWTIFKALENKALIFLNNNLATNSETIVVWSLRF